MPFDSDYPLEIGDIATASQSSGKKTPSTGSTQNTYGAWLELVASLDRDTKYLVISSGSTGGAIVIELRIGTGGAGSEVVKLTDLGIDNTDSLTFLIPLELLSGSRVAISIRNLSNSTDLSVDFWFVFLG